MLSPPQPLQPVLRPLSLSRSRAPLDVPVVHPDRQCRWLKELSSKQLELEVMPIRIRAAVWHRV